MLGKGWDSLVGAPAIGGLSSRDISFSAAGEQAKISGSYVGAFSCLVVFAEVGGFSVYL